MFPFLDLPFDLRAKVYNSLNVQDRTRLNIALPKQYKKEMKPIKTEKRLGVLSNAIKKKRVTKLSRAMTDFLCTQVSKEDPTLQDISAILSIPPLVLTSNIITAESIAAASTREQFEHIIRNVPPELYDNVIAHPMFNSRSPQTVMADYYVLCNSVLFDYIATNQKTDIARFRSSIKFTVYSVDILRVILKHFTLTPEERDAMYVYAIENMYTDSAALLQ